MRVLAVVLSCLLLATAIAEARPERRPVKQHPQKPAKAKQHPQKQAKAKQHPQKQAKAKQHPQKQAKRAAMKTRADKAAKARPRVAVKQAKPAAKPAPTAAKPAPAVAEQGALVAAEQGALVAAEPSVATEPRPIDPYTDLDAALAAAPRRGPGGQSIGVPWAGRLQDATRLQLGDGAYIRRPHRAFGTRTTVEHVRRAVLETLASHPDAHVLAIGDLSAERGGWISEHSSHRSGRDVDLGLFYKHPPDGYPASFVNATAETLDRAATWTLLANLLATHGEDGGVQMIFLDYNVQGLLYRWAKENGVKEQVLAPIFQYPNGRWANGIVRHEPHHADHLHVRFRCAKADTACY